VKALKCLLTRSVIGSAAGTSALAILGGIMGAEPTAMLLGTIGGKLLEQATSVMSGLLTSSLENAWAGDPIPGFNHDFRKALARALIATLEWGDGDAPQGPLQSALLAETTLPLDHLRRLLKFWRSRVEASLADLPDSRLLEEILAVSREVV